MTNEGELLHHMLIVQLEINGYQGSSVCRIDRSNGEYVHTGEYKKEDKVVSWTWYKSFGISVNSNGLFYYVWCLDFLPTVNGSSFRNIDDFFEHLAKQIE